jgi:hypothetical protein
MADKADKKAQAPKQTGVIDQVAERIRTSDNVLVALSKDPSVDELSAALGLTFILDKMGKHATAIFSGAVPNAIEFLEPEKTFETNTNSLQDFIIALDKEKADHLRYKIDGDFVKVYITPYKTTLDETDVEFSHGDFNVDLVVALNVAGAAELDSALSEYGRIMHDASSINIKASPAGNFADLEWGDPKSSSVSEMIYRLSEKLKEDEKSLVDKPIATSLLAGIVAATNRFSNEHTYPDTLNVASKLMLAGADQQLISSSIPVDILTNDVVDATKDAEPAKKKEEEKVVEASPREETPAPTPAPETPAPEAPKPEEPKPEEPKPEESKPEEAPAPEAPAETPAEAPKPEEPKSDETLGEEAEKKEKEEEEDPTNLEIRHGAVDFNPEEEPEEAPAEEVVVEAPIAAPEPPAAEAPAPMPAPEMPAPVPMQAPVPPANYPQIIPNVNPQEQMAPALAEPPIIPVLPPAPAAESVIIAPEINQEQVEKETHVAEPLSEEDLNPDDHAAENAIDAALQKAAAAARQNEVAQAQAQAQLNQMVAANTPMPNPVMQDLAQASGAAPSGIKNLTPPSEAMIAPQAPKDYAAMMSEALAEPTAPMTSPIESAPMMAPQPQMAAPAPMPQQQMAAPAPMPQQQMAPQAPMMPQQAPQGEFVAPLPMPDPNGILPPPPAPFQPEAAMPVADPTELPTAQSFAQQMQATNPAVATPAPMMAQPVAPQDMPVPASMAPVAPIMPAVPEDPITLSVGTNPGGATTAAVNGVNPVMQDQIYPADPSAFQIPGM